MEKLIEKAVRRVQGELLFQRNNLQLTIDQAVKKAESINVPVTICISDVAGQPKMLYRMDGANLVSVSLAPKKAASALAMKSQTKDLNKETNPGGELYQIETMMNGEIVTFAGGIPIVLNQEVIGAIGVSGGKVAEDQLICETAINAFLKGE